VGLGSRRAKYALERVEALRPWSGEGVALYEDGALVRGAGGLIVDYDTVAERAAMLGADGADTITVNFLTPTRMKHKGEYVRRPEFHVLIRKGRKHLEHLNVLIRWITGISKEDYDTTLLGAFARFTLRT